MESLPEEKQLETNEFELNRKKENRSPDSNKYSKDLEKINEKIKAYELYLKDKPLYYKGYQNIKMPNVMPNDLKKVLKISKKTKFPFKNDYFFIYIDLFFQLEIV
jgi:hypothetical protein